MGRCVKTRIFIGEYIFFQMRRRFETNKPFSGGIHYKRKDMYVLFMQI